MPVTSAPRRLPPRWWPAGPAWAAWVLAMLVLALTAELLAVVEQTMQPTRVSLWLRPHPAGTDRRSLDERGRLLPTRLRG